MIRYFAKQKHPSFVEVNGKRYPYDGEDAVYRVDFKGNVTGTILKEVPSKHPLIKVIFDDSSFTVEKQTKSFASIVEKVKKDYHTNTIHIVAHGTSGLAVINYLLQDENTHIDKFVTISLPLKGVTFLEDMDFSYSNLYLNPTIADDLLPNSNTLRYLWNDKTKFDKKTKVFSIAGAYQERYEYDLEHDAFTYLDSAWGLESFTTNFKKAQFLYDYGQILYMEDVFLSVYNFILEE